MRRPRPEQPPPVGQAFRQTLPEGFPRDRGLCQPAVEVRFPRFAGPEFGYEGRHISTPREGVHEVADFSRQPLPFGHEASGVRPLPGEAVEGHVDGGLEDRRVKEFALDGLEDGGLRVGNGQMQIVAADGCAFASPRRAHVHPSASPTIDRALRLVGRAAGAAQQASEDVFNEARRRAAQQPAIGLAEIPLAAVFALVVYGKSQLRRDDAEFFGLDAERRGIGVAFDLLALVVPGIPIPLDDAAIDRAAEHVAHARRSPPGWASSLRTRSRATVRVQGVGNRPIAVAERGKFVDAPHRGSFDLIDTPLDVSVHAEIVVAEHTAPGNVAGLRFAEHRVSRALAGFLSLEFRRKSGEAHHHLVDGVIQLTLPAIEVGPNPHAGACDLPEQVRRLMHLAAESGVFRHHEHVERRTGLQRVEQSHEAGASFAENRP